MYTVFTHERAGRLSRLQKEYVLEEACRVLDARVEGWGMGKELFLESIAACAAGGNTPVLFTGDTTFSEAAAAVPKGSTLGYLPGGTGCFMGFVTGYARPYAKYAADIFALPDTFALPRLRSYLGSAARHIREGAHHPLDLLVHDTGRKLLMASIGFDPRVLRRREEYLRLGYGAGRSYGLAIRDVVQEFRGVDAAVEIDGERIERTGVASVLVTKVPYYGFGLMIAPYARIDDGLLHVRIISQKDVPSALLSGLRGVYVGEHLSGRNVSISTGKPEPVQFDGDVLGERLINGFAVLPAQVNLRY